MSRTKEQKAWDAFKAGVDPRQIRALRIENLYSGEGMPDVLCQNRHSSVFWLEFKALDSWPVRDGTKPLKSAFEPGQIAFARSWINWGGWSFVVLRVGLDFYLLDPEDNLTEMTRHDIIGHAVREGKKEIIEYLEIL